MAHAAPNCAIAMLGQKLSADWANTQHEKGVCAAEWWAAVAGVGCCSRGSVPLQSNAVIPTLASDEIAECLLLTLVKVTPELLRWPHLHISIHRHFPKPLGEVWMVVSSCVCSAPWYLSMSCVHCHILYLVWTETIKKLVNNIVFIKRKATDLGKKIFYLLSSFQEIVDRLCSLKKGMSFFPGPFIKRPCPAQNLGNVAYFLSLAVEVSLSVIAGISRLWHCADLSLRART